jgi:hypothetical protein
MSKFVAVHDRRSLGAVPPQRDLSGGRFGMAGFVQADLRDSVVGKKTAYLYQHARAAE